MVTIPWKQSDFTKILSTQYSLTTHFKLYEDISTVAANVYISFISVSIRICLSYALQQLNIDLIMINVHDEQTNIDAYNERWWTHVYKMCGQENLLWYKCNKS
jgi:hypothetical protein